MNKKIIILSTLLILPLLLTGCNLFKTTDTPKQNKSEATVIPGVNPGDSIPDSSTKDYMVNKGESNIVWSGSKIIGGDHSGNIEISNGDIKLGLNQNLISANFTLDMSSITDKDGSQGLVDHLKNEDFFDVENYPEAVLNIIKISHDDGNQYIIIANLTIKDTTNQISFPAEVNISDNKVNAKANFTIDRTDWNIKYGSDKFFKSLGDSAIKDQISFEVEIFAYKN